MGAVARDLSAQSEETSTRQIKRAFFKPRRFASRPAGKVPATPPSVMALVNTPIKFYLRPRSRR